MGAPGLWVEAAARGTVRFFLSDNGRAPLGPFPLMEVKRMIRKGFFSSEVLLRPENDLGWMSYREFVQRVRTNRAREFALTCWRRIRPPVRDAVS